MIERAECRRRHRRARARVAPELTRGALDWSARGRAEALERIGAPVLELTGEQFAALGLDAELLAACRRRRGYDFDSRIEQLVQAKLLERGRWESWRADELVRVRVTRELGRAILAAAFGPANRARLEVYWDAIHEHGQVSFWLYDFMGAFIGPALRHAPAELEP